jgi:hypothetical protein
LLETEERVRTPQGWTADEALRRLDDTEADSARFVVEWELAPSEAVIRPSADESTLAGASPGRHPGDLVAARVGPGRRARSANQ